MKNIYRWLKLFGKLKSPRIKLLGLLGLHVSGRRYLGVFFDPVIACNLRCKMCYFSDAKSRKSLHGTLEWNDVEAIAKALFHRTLKLQIGCGAEPTVYQRLADVVRLGRKYHIPYISLTTNGNLLTFSKLKELAEAGLDELTISAHGIRRETYEFLMTHGNYESFLRLLADLTALKREFPAFSIRLNYTLNEDNMEELSRFWEVFRDVPLDVVQLRPIQQIGETECANFSLQHIAARYDDILLPLVEECRAKGITCLIPMREHLEAIEENAIDTNKVIEDLTYCYLSPNACWKEGFDYHRDTFESYCKRTHRVSYMLKKLFGRLEARVDTKGKTTRKLNYTVK